MDISAIIPAWNAERHIGRAIRSVLAQTRPADEIIVVDDGSTDGTGEAVRAFGDSVRLITQPNGGASVARNAGIAAATGGWIAFLDADDEWLPEKLKLQTEHLQCNPALKWTTANFLTHSANGTVCGEKLSCEKGVELLAGKTYFDDFLQAFLDGADGWTGTMLIHRSVFDAVGGFEPGMKRGQDTDMWFRIAYQFPKVGYIPQPLAIYHLDTPNSSTKINDRADFVITLVERHRELSRRHSRAEAYQPCLVRTVQYWVRQFIRQNRKTDVRVLLDRYRHELPLRFCREMAVRLRMPPLGQKAVEAYQTMKAVIRGRP